jgi:hypothetical protein
MELGEDGVAIKTLDRVINNFINSESSDHRYIAKALKIIRDKVCTKLKMSTTP